MNTKRRPRLNRHSSLVFLICLSIVPSTTVAQPGGGEIPKNAHSKSYGGSWECDRGYREADGRCVAVKMPPNAYPTRASFGRGWNCKRGFRAVGAGCVAITVPANAFLNPHGDRWECERGYRRIGEGCAVVVVPRNGYLSESSYSRGWKCERGYRVTGEACLAIALPKNAHLDRSGNRWDCDRPYRKQQGRCILPD